MGALVEGTDYEVLGVEPGPVVSKIWIRCINTVDDADTLTVDLPTYGIAADGLIGAFGFEHTTDNSVSVQAQPTTAVASGVLTLTIGGSNDNNPRFLVVYGMKSTAGAAAL